MSTTVQTIEVPDIGDFSDVPIIEILVSAGDTVSVEDPLVTLESDKATMDVPAPIAGVVKDVVVSVGDKVSEGSALLTIEGADARAATERVEPEPAPATAEEQATASAAPAPAAPEPSAPEPSPPEPSPSEPSPPPPAASNGGPIYASPSVRRLARELGVELAGRSGSGRKGRITKDDVQGFARGGGAPAPA